MFDENWNLQTHNFDEYFIDRNPDCFAVLLDLLRTGELCIPSNIPEKLLHKEALFYGLLDYVQTAKWGQFDGNRLQFSQSVMGQALGDNTAIQAGPDGGCYVVHACERLGRGGGGMGLFSAGMGELRHRFQVTHDDQVKSYTAGALSFSSDYKIFSSCKGRSNEDKSMVWSWSDVGAPATDERRVWDAIAMEETASICVVNEYEDLGFMDLKSCGGSVRWCSRSRLMKGKMPEEPCYPKLVLHDGQLFSSMNDFVVQIGC
ncbi:BTB/POZ domain-containing protein [Camellia lanceoleosa]|uniref:BTB/POZ domain-containing protein n=1 Tax=Camellia lanceoleosa TaxID=1840588 RepID=A0ACC0I2A3_9ERIC|nr:BTB/POZ domain-containing protein [Camellia lanceoleosa]